MTTQSSVVTVRAIRTNPHTEYVRPPGIPVRRFRHRNPEHLGRGAVTRGGDGSRGFVYGPPSTPEQGTSVSSIHGGSREPDGQSTAPGSNSEDRDSEHRRQSNFNTVFTSSSKSGEPDHCMSTPQHLPRAGTQGNRTFYYRSRHQLEIDPHIAQFAGLGGHDQFSPPRREVAKQESSWKSEPGVSLQLFPSNQPDRQNAEVFLRLE